MMKFDGINKRDNDDLQFPATVEDQARIAQESGWFKLASFGAMSMTIGIFEIMFDTTMTMIVNTIQPATPLRSREPPGYKCCSTGPHAIVTRSVVG